MQGILFLDDSKYSTKISRSKVFNVIKSSLIVVDKEHPEVSPAQYNVTVYPTLVLGGSKYVGVKPILSQLEDLSKSTHKKPLF